VDLAAQEVDVLTAQSQRLPLAQARPDCRDHQSLEVRRRRGDQTLDLIHGQRDHPGSRDRLASDLAARAHGDQLVLDSSVEARLDEAEVVLHGLRRHVLRGAGDQGLDV
jgi:hypothetical protein